MTRVRSPLAMAFVKVTTWPIGFVIERERRIATIKATNGADQRIATRRIVAREADLRCSPWSLLR